MRFTPNFIRGCYIEEEPLNDMVDRKETTENHPHPAMIGLSPLEQAEVVLTGYRDCAAEAIRYLVEIEHFSLDDPIVEGLRKHLCEQERRLNVGQILTNIENNPEEQNTVTPSFNDSGICDQTQYSDNSVEEFSSQSEIDGTTVTSLHENSSVINALAEELMSLIESDIGDEEDDMEDEENVDTVDDSALQNDVISVQQKTNADYINQ